jgi:DNA repair protein RadC
MARLRDYPHEVFTCLFLDNRHRVIAYDELFHGTINGATVHPSGVAEPSQADIKLTQRLQDALNLIDVRVLDHVVIGDGESVALAEQGLI